MLNTAARFVAPHRFLASVLLFALGIAWAAAHQPATAAEKPFVAFSTGKADVTVSRQGEDYLRLGLAGWGPNWAWTGWQGEARGEAGATTAALTANIAGTAVRLDFRAAQTAPKRLQFDYTLSAPADVPLTLIAVELTPGKRFAGREAVALSGGERTSVRVPLERRGLGRQVEAVALSDAAGETAVVRFNPPSDIPSDGAARVVLAEGTLRGGQPRRLTITIDLPAETQYYPSVGDLPDLAGLDQWYEWRAESDAGPSIIGMEDWFEAPAGKRGRIVRRDHTLLYGGQPIKLWGLNLCFSACAPEAELADRRAAFYRKYGINAVRLHKFADGSGWAGVLSRDSAVEFDPAGLDRMDYQVAAFKKAGIFVKLSAHFGALKLGAADRQLVPFLDELGEPKGSGGWVTTPHSAIHYSPELQRVHIQQIVNLLRHKNPHTGLTYAEDPAIAFVEIINEQSILFYTSMAPLKASPTIRRQVGARFSAWLRDRYGDQERLEQAWGRAAFDSFQNDGFPAGERLDRDNILPLGNPWYWDPNQLAGSQAFRRQRLLDTLEFLYELQNEFYDRFVRAVRAAGYEGEIVASNWQAGRALSHFANLHSDYLVGTIDRHNYFGSNQANASMLRRAGSGMLSSGMQQAADRPFMLSEWIHVFPNEMGVEGPAILGAYGMGLQDWDVSFIFQNRDDGGMSRRIGRDQWDVTAPQVIGVFPAVARHILRGDVAAAEVLAVRNVHVPSLFRGQLGFDDSVAQGYDDKELDSSKVSARTLAAARCVVAFTDAPVETPVFDLAPFQQDGEIVASTGQLRWREATGQADGYFTLDTPGTKGVVGFAQGRHCQLGPVAIEPQSGFGAVYVTARDPQGTVAESRDLLVVALARARNTGMKFSPDGARMLAAGGPPILMEPVRARIAVDRPGPVRVYLLDHDGRLTEQQLAVEGGAFTIDGARDRTPYYLVRFGP